MLFEKLDEYSCSEVYPFHMPGHKRNTELLGSHIPYDIDITEITGFDNLHCADSIIADLQNQLAKFYSAKESFLLVNGSTCGIMSAITSICPFGSKIIVARNCHKSVYKAIELYGLEPVWVMPVISEQSGICGEITSASVAEAIALYPDAKLVVITSPTYEGIISDVQAIGDVCRKSSIPLLCDMAHGAHLPLFSEYRQAFGADIAVTSLHKTLPCLTQTACISIHSDVIDADALKAKLAVFETSSPSYILMASVDRTITLLEKSGDELSSAHQKRIQAFRKLSGRLKHLKLLGDEFFCYDFTKLVISCKDTSISGGELFARLRDEFALECEMAGCDYVLAMTSICDTDDGISRLENALFSIDEGLTFYSKAESTSGIALPKAKYTSYQALQMMSQYISLHDSKSRISAEYIWAYPPGIPIIAPGEEITDNTISAIESLLKCGVQIQLDRQGQIKVVCE